MQIKVNGETPFKVMKNTFTVSKTSSGYTLEWCTFNSENDNDWQAYPQDVPADEGLICNGATPFTYFRLKNNADENVLVIL